MSSGTHSRRSILGGMVGAAAALISRRSSGDEKTTAPATDQWKCTQVWSCYDYRYPDREIYCPPPNNNSCEYEFTGWGLTEEDAVADLNRKAALIWGPKCAMKSAVAKPKTPRYCTPPAVIPSEPSSIKMVCCSGYCASSSFRISLPGCLQVVIAFDGYGSRRISALRDAREKAEKFAASIQGRICCKVHSVVKPCCQRPVVVGCASCG
jgi:hypothetical protein